MSTSHRSAGVSQIRKNQHRLAAADDDDDNDDGDDAVDVLSSYDAAD